MPYHPRAQYTRASRAKRVPFFSRVIEQLRRGGATSMIKFPFLCEALLNFKSVNSIADVWATFLKTSNRGQLEFVGLTRVAPRKGKALFPDHTGSVLIAVSYPECTVGRHYITDPLNTAWPLWFLSCTEDPALRCKDLHGGHEQT